jgi:hypothetical protein
MKLANGSLFWRPLALQFLALCVLSGCGRSAAAPARTTPGYVLVDAEERAVRNPATFELPSREKRRSRKAGDLVKVILGLPPGAPPREASGERPWFKVKEVKPGPRYVAALDNDTVVFIELKLGDLVEFGPEHIIQIWEEKEGK